MKTILYIPVCILQIVCFTACISDAYKSKGSKNGMAFAAYALSSAPDDFSLTFPMVIKVCDVSKEDDTPHVKTAAKVHRVDFKTNDDGLIRSCYVYCNSRQVPYTSLWKRSSKESTNSIDTKHESSTAMCVSTALALFAIHYPEENLWSANITYSKDKDAQVVFIEDDSSMSHYLFSFQNGRCISGIDH